MNELGDVMSMKYFLCILSFLMLAACSKPSITTDEVLEKANQSMSEINNMRVIIEAEQDTFFDQMNLKNSSTIECDVIINPLRYYTTALLKINSGMFQMKVLGYRSEDGLYVKPPNEEWSLISDKEFQKSIDLSLMEFHRPVVYSDLLMAEKQNINIKEEGRQIVLEVPNPSKTTEEKISDIFLQSVEDEYGEVDVEEFNVRNFSVTIDRITYRIKSIYIEESISGKFISDGSKLTAEQKISVNYSDYNQITIELPEELKEIIKNKIIRSAPFFRPLFI